MTDTVAPPAARHGYRLLVRRKRWLLAVLALLLVGSLLLDVALGSVRLGLGEVVQALLWPDGAPAQARVVIWDIRLPVALMAVVVGAALSVAGAQMQTILNNPLASPFTLGISAAASFGAALGLAFGVRLFPVAAEYMLPLNAFLMAMLTALVIHALSLRRGVTTETVVLLGIALVFTFNALLALVQYFATEQAVAAVVFWTMGSLTKATWAKLGITALVLAAVLPVFVRRAWALTALRLGDDKAASLGIDVRRLRLQTLLLVSLLAAFPVAFAGGEVVAVIGPNAAGKSTLFKRMTGLLDGPGEVRIDGARRGGDGVGYMPQDSATSAALTVYESVLLARKQNAAWAVRDADLALIDGVLASLGISDIAFRGLGELSGGQRQLAAQAQTLVRDPEILLMDEPTSALDLHRQLRVLTLVRDLARQRGLLVFIALHDLNQVLRFADKVLVLADGAARGSGPCQEVITPDLLRQVYRIDARIERCSRGTSHIIIDG